MPDIDKPRTESVGERLSVASRFSGDLALAGTTALAYFLIGLASQRLSISGEGIAAFWPANGFLLALLLKCRPGARVPVLLAGIAAAFAAHRIDSGSALPAAGFAFAKILEVFIALKLIGGLGLGADFPADIRRTFLFLSVVSTVSAGFSGLIGAGVQMAVHGGAFWHHWLAWWLVDVVGLMLVTPAILSWRAPDIAWTGKSSRYPEFAACLAATSVMAYLVFAHHENLWGPFGHPLPSGTFPFVLWGALRFGPRGAAGAHILVYVIAAYFTAQGIGPFNDDGKSPFAILTSVQAFHLIIVFCSMMPAVMINSHRRVLAELKEKETALNRSEKLFRSITEASLVGTLWLDMKGDCIYANPIWLSMAGMTEASLKTGGWRRAIHDEDRDGLFKAWDAFLAGGPAVVREYRLLKPDGTVTWVSGWSTALPDENGAIQGYLDKTIDITDHRRAKAELVKAIKSAELANQAKSQFLAHMSHEIRTPLNGVLGMISLLDDTQLTREQRSYAQVARESGGHLLSLINQILDFSKIESGHFDLQETEFALGEVVESAVSSVTETAQKKGLEILSRLDAEIPPRFVGDPLRLQQVLLNLVGNAVKFSDHGEIRVSVRKLADIEGKTQLLFEVSDQGPGIPESVARDLFQPFRQGDPSLARKTGGTGLGLAISKDLVGKMGGKLWVESRNNQGSRFQFTVCLPVAVHPAEGRSAASNVTLSRPVWIGEPHPGHCAQLEDMFRDWGYRVRTGMEGAPVLTGLESAAREGSLPAFIVQAIPEESRQGSFLEILESARRLGVPVFLTVPFISQTQATRFMRAGAAGLFTKPFRAASILASIKGTAPEPGSGAPAGRDRPETRDQPRSIARGSPPRVLVVDDHPTNLMVASAMLAKMGCVVDTVSDGKGAIAAVQRGGIDLVLMDCQMPGMDGLRTTALIRGLPPPMRNVPIIALTAHAVAGVKEKCLAAGMDDYLPKPYGPDALEGMLRDWLGFEAGTGPEGAPAAESGGAGSGNEGVDWKRLEALDDGTAKGRQNVRKLARLFLDTARADLSEIGVQVEGGRIQELSRSLHRLKGGCGTIGATAMSGIVSEMETRLPEGDREGQSRLLARLETALRDTEASFRWKLESL